MESKDTEITNFPGGYFVPPAPPGRFVISPPADGSPIPAVFPPPTNATENADDKEFRELIENLANEENETPENKSAADTAEEDLNFQRKSLNDQIVQIGYDLKILSNRLSASQRGISEIMTEPEIGDEEYMAFEEALSYLTEFQLAIEDIGSKNNKLLSSLKESVGQFIKWRNKKKKKNDKTVISYVRESDVFTLRPVGQAQLIYSLYNQMTGKFACVNDVQQFPFILNYSNISVSEKYALQVIDRQDKELKIVELAKSAYVTLSKIALTIFTEQEFILSGFGLADGFDFVLSRKGKGLNTRYSATLVGKTKLTNDEMKMVQAEMVSDMSEACGQIKNPDQLKRKLGI